MASSGGGVGGEDELKQLAELSKTLKEGERILAPTRRPDGTMRKPIRIRAGYVPQDEVAIYQSKGALWRREMASLQQCPPGYDPVLDAKPKTKSVKRNERKKEKRLQAALEKGKNSESQADGEIKREEVSSLEDLNHGSESIESVASQMMELSVSTNSTVVTLASNPAEVLNQEGAVLDIEKRIRALKKKIRLTEAQQQKTVQQDMKPEQVDRVVKLEGWRTELKLLEDKSAGLAAS
ncbi:partner of Y14 and mago isoform X2 [Malania oleifera]|uniref:partner of Y14 and mago isoform X2 n=1 Tax=Malania oleifera TaxID=397392 RepID=UPI0025AEC1F5|nr:partner of Y14 and mago isoform X2 [Malania oleifera]